MALILATGFCVSATALAASFPASITNTATVTVPIGTANTNAACTNANSTALASVCTASDTDVLAWVVTLTKAAPATAALNTQFAYQLAVGNTGSGPIPVGTVLTVTDVVPSGLTVSAATPGSGVSAVACAPASAVGPASLTCSITLGAALAAGTPSTAAAAPRFTLSVMATATGSLTNVASTDPTGGTSPPTPGAGCAPGPSCASVVTNVSAASNVLVSKQFSPSTIVSGGTSTLTITIANTAPGAVDLTGIGLTDNLPAGVSIASPPNLNTTCGSGVVSTSVVAGITSVTLVGGSVNAGASCTISANVTAP